MTPAAPHPLASATAFAEAHETPWTRDPLREPQRFGVHHDDPPPWNRLRGPVHDRQTQPLGALAARGLRVEPVERVEDRTDLLGGDPRAGVADLDLRLPAAAA